MAYGGSCSSSNGGSSVSNGIVNNTTQYPNGGSPQNLLAPKGDQIVSEYSGRYAYAANRGEIFAGGQQSTTTGVTFTVGLTTTYTGMILINPIGSGKSAEVLFANCTTSIAATVAGPVALIGGGSGAGVTAFTAIATTLWGTTRLDSNAATNASVCSLAAAGITLVGTPRYLAWLGLISTGATSVSSNGPGITMEYAGSITVGPGGYVAFGSNVAIATTVCSFMWRESLVQV